MWLKKTVSLLLIGGFLIIPVSMGRSLQEEGGRRIEAAIGTMKDTVLSLLEEEAASHNLPVDPNFLAVATGPEGGVLAVVGVGDLSQIDDLTIAQGANVLFLYWKAPSGSQVPTGFYMVQVQQLESGEWKAQLIGNSSTFEVPIITVDLALGIVGISAEWGNRCASASLRTPNRHIAVFLCRPST